MENQAELNHISSLLGYKSPERYVARAQFIFDSVDLRGKRVLEIGCGKGALLAWAGLQGAAFVLGLEPEEDGARSGSSRVLESVVSALRLNTIEIRATRLNDQFSSDPFDIIILYNVINHLDEQAVKDLDKNPASYSTFLDIVKKIKTLTAKRGIVILADAARSNLWGDLGRTSPFAKTIEWNKHQDPTTWQRLFEEVGYKLLDLRWSHLYPLGKWSSNFLIHYMTISHFVMRFMLNDEHTTGK